MSHIIFVCTNCASIWQNGKKQGVSGGEQLLTQVLKHYHCWELKSCFSVKKVECMSACNNACSVSFAAPDKHTYLFGDLDYKDKIANTAVAILEFANLYYQSDKGIVNWIDRPKEIKNVLARIPPIP